MKILLCQDETLNLNLNALCEGLNRITDDDFHVDISRSAFKLKPGSIKHPASHLAASARLADEINDVDLVIIFTATPYENNYFFEEENKVTIVSFYAWGHLTSLSMENGVVFFLAGILRFNLSIPEAHDKETRS